MTLGKGWRDLEKQKFKDRELFGSVLAASTTGSVALIVNPSEIVGDVLIFNSGSTDVYYNLGTSGAGAISSTSGTLLEAGAKICYNDVGFDVVSAITTAGVSKVYVHKTYSSRP